MILAEIEGCREQIKQIGCARGADLLALPNNSNSNRVAAIAASAGVKWVRGNGTMLRSAGLVGDANPLVHGCTSFAGMPDAVQMTAFVDLMIQYGASAHIYSHQVYAWSGSGGQPGNYDSGNILGNSNIGTSEIVFRQICAMLRARIDAGLIDVVTPSQFVACQSWPHITSVIRSPSTLDITPGASPYSHINTGYEPIRIIVSGGSVSDISYSENGSTFMSFGETSGVFSINPGDRVRITYTVAPTITQRRGS